MCTAVIEDEEGMEALDILFFYLEKNKGIEHPYCVRICAFQSIIS